MTVKTVHTEEVQELLNRVAGFHTEGGDERSKKIVHRFMGDIFQLIEDFDVTPEEFWSAVNYVSDLGKNNDVIVIAVPPSRTGGDHQEYLDAFEQITEPLIPARLVVVGGAGATEVNGVRLVDTPGFPEEYKAEATTGAEVYDMFTSVSGITWTVVAPAPVIMPARRTGSYTLGTDSPAGDFVSSQDFAVAILDEIETPVHANRRMSVASEK